MMHYLSIKKILTVVELIKLFFEKIALKYEMLNDIIINKDNLFINAFLFSLKDEAKTKHCLSFANR